MSIEIERNEVKQSGMTLKLLGKTCHIQHDILPDVVLCSIDQLGSLHSMIDILLMELSDKYPEYVDSFNAIDEHNSEGKEDYE
tara:strand:+ start:8691 stop:8939 length:249 start_codon:yes stop_codon:yes gene_type:complete